MSKPGCVRELLANVDVEIIANSKPTTPEVEKNSLLKDPDLKVIAPTSVNERQGIKINCLHGAAIFTGYGKARVVNRLANYLDHIGMNRINNFFYVRLATQIDNNFNFGIYAIYALFRYSP